MQKLPLLSRNLLLVVAIMIALPAVLFSQNARFDNFALVTGNLAGATNVVITAPGALVSVYNYPGAGVDCLAGGCTKATTYADRTTGTACGSTTQLIIGTSNVCVGASDNNGNFGFWAPFGVVQFCITGTGLAGKCYNVMLPADMTAAQVFPNVLYTFGGPITVNGLATFNGGITSTGNITNTGNLTVNGFTTTTGLQDKVSGTGCADALDLFNIDTTPTNPHKYLRVNQATGALELVNSACNTVIFSVTDIGSVTGSAASFTAVDAPSYTSFGIPTTNILPSDFTLAANTNLQSVISVNIPSSTAATILFSCHFEYTQASAAVADQIGVQVTTLAPTYATAKGTVYTSASAFAANNANWTTTTATPIVTFTPSAITTIWNADMDGAITMPGGSTATLQFMFQQSNSSDLLTIKKNSWCRLF